MSSEPTLTANPVVRTCYERLGDLLDRGDDVFVEEGPAIVQAAVAEPGFFDGVVSEYAPAGGYTRRKVIGDPGRHVIRFMEWPPGFTLLPHEHHGRPCFEVLVDGLLCVVDMDAVAVEDDHYRLDVLGTTVTHPGEAAVVDPRRNDIHAVYSPVRSRSLHVYPDDKHFSYGYCLVDDGRDLFRRERFELKSE
jgi:hypothetical protein